MPDDIQRSELDRLYTTLDEGFRGTHARLDLLNDRTRAAEHKIAVLEATAPAAKSAAWGGGFGAAVVGLAEAIRWLIGR